MSDSMTTYGLMSNEGIEPADPPPGTQAETIDILRDSGYHVGDDMELAFESLRQKKADYDNYWNYYYGDHPQVWMTEKIRQMFAGVDIRFQENWCKLVIDACLERIILDGMRVNGSQDQQDTLTHIWQKNQMRLHAKSVHRSALVCGEGFLFAWPDDEGVPRVYYNDPRLCHIVYDDEDPLKKSFGAKWWVRRDGMLRMNMYYPDTIYYYISTRTSEYTDRASQLIPFTEDGYSGGSASNTYGVVPLFHFRPDITMRASDLDDAIPLQNAINKLAQNGMVVGENDALPIIYVISQMEIGKKISIGPGRILDLPGSDGDGQATQIGQLPGAQMTPFTTEKEAKKDAMLAITRTPSHYARNEGAPSGESLMVREAPLVKKAEDRTDSFSVTWSEMADFLLQIEGYADVVQEDITPIWRSPNSVQPLTRAQITQLRVVSGIPLGTVLKREERWTDKDMSELAKDKVWASRLDAQVQDIINPIPTVTTAPDGTQTTSAPPVMPVVDEASGMVLTAGGAVSQPVTQGQLQSPAPNPGVIPGSEARLGAQANASAPSALMESLVGGQPAAG